ncbi:UDP-N-acetylmuramoyl-L-alanine--D-glutamate ligase [Fusobacterium necrophorum]|uniref:UDP-N-acetylmuramoyl-L-alanine--D-glutamate ligase n=1 Tax=Fusobacterium necrophorum TaxID=859 RepID=UPI00370F01B1
MKKAMVLGMGISGRGAKTLLEKEGYTVIAVDDSFAMSSQEAMKYIDEIDVFIKSPGVPYTDLVKAVQEKGIKIQDEIEIAYQYMVKYNKKINIVAVTGTNGKTTTTSKIAELLNFAGKKAAAAGNIGRSFAEVLLSEEQYDYAVLELSSYQLENVYEFTPYISMVTNLTPDHLTRYANLEDYYNTKFHICQNQEKENSFFLFNIDHEEVRKRETLMKGRKISLSRRQEADTCVKDGNILFQGEKVMSVSELSLKGSHNLENSLFIVTAGKLLGLDSKIIRDFLRNTEPLEHRMERCFQYGKLQFINDSKGTNIDSAKFALEAYPGCILICGGFDKKVDLTPLADVIVKQVKEVYLIGVIADKIKALLVDRNYQAEKIHSLDTIENSLRDMKQRFTKEDQEVILLSPATSSFDQFKSFEHRGQVFKELVHKIFG